MRDFLQAISFLTILPVGSGTLMDGKALVRSMAFYPIVGLLIGALSALGFYLLSLLLPKPLVLWLTIGLLALLTRGLHLDGFADTMDGLAAGGPKERILEVMRDSRIGAFGVIGLVLLMGAKYLALDQIPSAVVPPALILMAAAGRNAMVLVCHRSPYARSGTGLARPFTENLGLREVVFSFISALVIALLSMGLTGVLILLGISLFAYGYRFFFIRRLGGVTGDVLGAANELSEVLCLILAVILRP